MTSHAYRTDFVPSAPAARFTFVYGAWDGRNGEAEGVLLLDTGADVSLVPADCVRRLASQAGPLPYGQAQVADFNGVRHGVRTYVLDVVPQDLLPDGGSHEFYVTEGEFGVAGRDLLNRHLLELDGPHGLWRVGQK